MSWNGHRMVVDCFETAGTVLRLQRRSSSRGAVLYSYGRTIPLLQLCRAHLSLAKPKHAMNLTSCCGDLHGTLTMTRKERWLRNGRLWLSGSRLSTPPAVVAGNQEGSSQAGDSAVLQSSKDQDVSCCPAQRPLHCLSHTRISSQTLTLRLEPVANPCPCLRAALLNLCPPLPIHLQQRLQ